MNTDDYVSNALNGRNVGFMMSSDQWTPCTLVIVVKLIFQEAFELLQLARELLILF